MNRFDCRDRLAFLVVAMGICRVAVGQIAPDLPNRNANLRHVGEPALTQAFTLKAHHTSVAAVAFSPSGKTLASMSNDGSVKLWDVAKQTQCGLVTGFSTKGRGQGDRDVCFSPDGKLLAAATSGHSIKVVDIATEEIRWSQSDGARSIAFSPKGDTLVTTDWESPWAKIWDAQTGKAVAKLRGNAAEFPADGRSQGSVAFSPIGKSFTTIIGGGQNVPAQLIRWDNNLRKPEHQFNLKSTRVNAMDYSPDGKLLAAGGDYDQILVFSVVHKSKEKIDRANVAELFKKLDDDRFSVRELAHQKLLDHGEAIFDQVSKASTRSMSVEGRFRVSALLKAIVSRRTKPRAILGPMKGYVMGIEFSANGRLLAACSRTGQTSRGEVALWKTSNLRTPIFRWSGQGMNSLSISPDGQHLAVACHDGKIIVWKRAVAK